MLPVRSTRPPDGVAVAAASMHDDLGEEARKLANGSVNVPVHQWQAPAEGSDKTGVGGDSVTRDPIDITLGGVGWRGPQPRGSRG